MYHIPLLEELAQSVGRYDRLELQQYELSFKKPAGTSRGIMRSRRIWLLIGTKGKQKFYAECAPLPGLSFDYRKDYHKLLLEQIEDFNKQDYRALQEKCLLHFPSSNFTWESLFIDTLFQKENAFFKGKMKPVEINGLIWMGEVQDMKDQALDLKSKGFDCIKLKIAALSWEEEMDVLKYMRSLDEKLTIRVDANGGFSSYNLRSKLEDLKQLNVHSIEQPLPREEEGSTAEFCKNPIIPIALDEQLLKPLSSGEKERLLDRLNPDYLVLKPGIMGGFYHCDQWIELATERGIGWWITSSLESNLGLYFIARYCASKQNPLAQGLGTGSLYTNNFASPLHIKGKYIFEGKGSWNLNKLGSAS